LVYYKLLSFESSTSVPEGKIFFLGALAGLAKAGAAKAAVARAGIARAGVARAGIARAGVARAGIARAGASIAKSPIKTLGGLTISPSFQKNNSNTTNNSYDYSTNSTVNYNK
jgi:hypothetical protein